MKINSTLPRTLKSFKQIMIEAINILKISLPESRINRTIIVLQYLPIIVLQLKPI